MRGGNRNMGDWVSAAVSAVQLMTKAPIPYAPAWNERVGRRSIVFYPLAGSVVGLLIGAVYAGLSSLLPDAAAAACVVVIWVWATGALHLDGWMDTADAAGSYRSRERMLEIMKDPRVGAMGVAAGSLLMISKFAFIFSLLGYSSAGSLNVGAALSVVPVIARAFVPWAVVGWPYAGGSGGMGAALRAAGWRHAAASVMVAAGCVFALLLCFGSGDPLMLLPAVVVGVLFAAIGGLVGAAWLSRRFGGLTGDSYGALVEGLELLLLLVLVAAGSFIFTVEG